MARPFEAEMRVAFEPIPDYGDIFELGEFMESVKSGMFTDWDGHGFYAASKNRMSNVFAKPSDISKGDIDGRNKWYYVVWFNK